MDTAAISSSCASAGCGAQVGSMGSGSGRRVSVGEGRAGSGLFRRKRLVSPLRPTGALSLHPPTVCLPCSSLSRDESWGADGLLLKTEGFA